MTSTRSTDSTLTAVADIPLVFPSISGKAAEETGLIVIANGLARSKIFPSLEFFATARIIRSTVKRQRPVKMPGQRSYQVV